MVIFKRHYLVPCLLSAVLFMVDEGEARAGLASRVIANGEGKFGNHDELKIAKAFQRGSLKNSAVLLNDGDAFVISTNMAGLMESILKKAEIIHELAKDLVERVDLIDGDDELEEEELNKMIFIIREMQLQTTILQKAQKDLFNQLSAKDSGLIADGKGHKKLSDLDLRTQLMFEAFDRGNEGLASFWIAAGVRMTTQHDGKAALRLAVTQQWLVAAERLIDNGAKADDDNETLLLQAVREGASAELVEMLIISLNEDLDAVENGMGQTALHLAVNLNRVDLVKLLIEHKGLNGMMEIQDEQGFRPLHSAVKSSRLIIDLLLGGGADLNSRTRSGMTALHVAVIENKASAVELLLESGADPSVKDYHGHTPLDYAKPHPDLEKMLKNYLGTRRYREPLQ